MVDWAHIFGFSVNPAEMVVRGTAIYWFIFALFRFILRRDIGAIGIADVMMVVLIADAASNGMSGNYSSVTDGCILISTIAAWNYAVDWASFRFPMIRRLAEPPPLLLIKDGKLQRKAMRQELLTTSELQSKLREQGIDDFNEVRAAYLEDSGEISVLRYDGHKPEKPLGSGKDKVI
jgi:uncharacterized membrane protein YcaP (DUF421 family)